MRTSLVLAISLALSAPLAAESLTFSATGCGPYAPEEEKVLEDYVKLVNADEKSTFLVHLGDIVSSSRKSWPESQYARVANILRTSRIPVFIVPGDNEWNDLDRPEVGWGYWVRHFSNFEKNFKDAPQADRQMVRPENFAFASKGVLLIGINLVGGRVHDAKEWASRHRQNADWVREMFEKHRDRVRAAVILAQAEPNRTHESFTKPFAEIARTFGKPVLFLHADGHRWQVHPKWLAPNVTRVMTDQVRLAPPVLVTVTDDPAQPFVFDRRLRK